VYPGQSLGKDRKTDTTVLERQRLSSHLRVQSSHQHCLIHSLYRRGSNSTDTPLSIYWIPAVYERLHSSSGWYSSRCLHPIRRRYSHSLSGPQMCMIPMARPMYRRYLHSLHYYHQMACRYGMNNTPLKLRHPIPLPYVVDRQPHHCDSMYLYMTSFRYRTFLLLQKSYPLRY
jgi:hypothetical protein